MVLLEIVTYSLTSAKVALAGGAHRIELCENTAEGGTTPSLGTIEAVKSLTTTPVHVMIRPRGGDFLYDADERAVMQRDLLHALKAGADGLVFGMLKPDATVDIEATRRLVDLAAGRPVTFHRAFDWAADPLRALEDVAKAGCSRVLTSGQAPSALEGAELIAELVRRTPSSLTVLAGGGIHAGNLRQLVERTGVREVHASLRGVQSTRMTQRPPSVNLGAPPDWAADSTPVVDEEKLRQVLALLPQL